MFNLCLWKEFDGKDQIDEDPFINLDKTYEPVPNQWRESLSHIRFNFLWWNRRWDIASEIDVTTYRNISVHLVETTKWKSGEVNSNVNIGIDRIENEIWKMRRKYGTAEYMVRKRELWRKMGKFNFAEDVAKEDKKEYEK